MASAPDSELSPTPSNVTAPIDTQATICLHKFFRDTLSVCFSDMRGDAKPQTETAETHDLTGVLAMTSGFIRTGAGRSCGTGAGIVLLT